MEDLTTGPLTRHLLKTTSFMLVTMIFQTLYFLIDLYWVGRLGTHAVAAVAIAGNFKPGIVVQTGSVIINMVLAPFLIFGWLTGHAFGVAGAAISSLVAIMVADIWLATYFLAKKSYLRFVKTDQKPRLATWSKM